MNWDTVQGDWKLVKGTIQKEWGKLTDDHLDIINGERVLLAGQIQKAYGISKNEAERQIKKFEKMQRPDS